MTQYNIVRPVHYDVRIEPDFIEGSFSGAVTIELEAITTTSTITLNVHDLDIRSTNLVHGATKKEIPLMAHSKDVKLQTLWVVLVEPLAAGSRAYLHHTYNGVIGRLGTGFHFSRTPDSMPVASTFMQPAHARSVFPCFDEPSHKAQFSVSLVVPAHLSCLGNMPVKSITDLTTNARRVFEFEKTPPMSSYLVAFAIGDFAIIENNDFRIPIRAYAPRNYKIEHCRYALDIAARSLQIMEKTFELPCGLSKLDIVAIPGAEKCMENWGLITMNPRYFVNHPSISAERLAQSASMVIHKIAHQWFGNLVTVESWDNVWLQESLAVFADVITREVLWDIGAWQEFCAFDMQRALKYDSSHFSHAIEPSVDPDGVPYFDVISYSKGCSVLRMVASKDGNELFLAGTRLFLMKHAYGNFRTEDFWACLKEVSGRDVQKIMIPWMKTAGYPIVVVAEGKESGTVRFTQSRFQHAGFSDAEVIYPIRVDIRTRNGSSWTALLERSRTIDIPHSDFYKINIDVVGFYRVASKAERIRELAENQGYMSVEDRIGMVSDTAALAFACFPYTKTSSILRLLQDFEDESSFFVWKVIIDTLNHVGSALIFEDQYLQDSFNNFHRHIVKKCLYKKGPFSRYDDSTEQRFKALMFGNSGGDEKVAEGAQVMLTRCFEGDGRALNPNIRRDIFKVVLQAGGRKEYDLLIGRLAAACPPEREDILCSLGYATHPSLVKRTLDRATSPYSIARKEMLPTLNGLATHEPGIAYLWRFISTGKWSKNKHLDLEKMLPIAMLVLDALTSTEHAKNAKKYLRSVHTKAFSTQLEMAFEGIAARAKWLQRDRQDMTEWLTRNGYYERPPCKILRGMMGFKNSVLRVNLFSCG